MFVLSATQLAQTLGKMENLSALQFHKIFNSQLTSYVNMKPSVKKDRKKASLLLQLEVLNDLRKLEGKDVLTLKNLQS